jgi:hypothetical protein
LSCIDDGIRPAWGHFPAAKLPSPNHLETPMPDDMEIRVPQNDERIDITDLKEVDYWTKWFGVSEARLRMAVASAGTIRDDLRVYLGLP